MTSSTRFTHCASDGRLKTHTNIWLRLGLRKGTATKVGKIT